MSVHSSFFSFIGSTCKTIWVAGPNFKRNLLSISFVSSCARLTVICPSTRICTSIAKSLPILRVHRLCGFLTSGVSFIIGEFYQFNLSSCIRQQNSLTAQFVSFSFSKLANIFYTPPIFTIINLCLL